MLGLQTDLFLTEFPSTVLYTHLISFMCTVHPACLILNLTTLTILVNSANDKASHYEIFSNPLLIYLSFCGLTLQSLVGTL
jgi:hypothetical protein